MGLVKSTRGRGLGNWLLPIMVLTACGGEGHRTGAGAPDEPVDIRIRRLDQDLFRGVRNEPTTFNLALQAEYGDLYATYVEDVLQATAAGDPRLPMVLTRFTMDPDWSAAQASADSAFGDMTAERALFNEAFTNLHRHFPDSLVPEVVIFNSGYNYGVLPADSVLGIGVEWFIGADHPVVARLAPENFPLYLKQRMRPDMLVPSAVKGWLLVHYTRDVQGGDLLTNLVETGKVMALLDAVLPGVDPAAKFAFTQEQLRWCEENEFQSWREIVGKEMLYSRKQDDIGRIMSDGPFTPGFPRESPGHIGEWIGYRMVQAHRKAHPDLTFAQLFAIDDPKVFLRSYKPR